MKAIFQTNKLIHIQYIETTQENLAAPNIIIRGPEVMLCGRYPFDGQKQPLDDQIRTASYCMSGRIHRFFQVFFNTPNRNKPLCKPLPTGCKPGILSSLANGWWPGVCSRGGVVTFLDKGFGGLLRSFEEYFIWKKTDGCCVSFKMLVDLWSLQFNWEFLWTDMIPIEYWFRVLWYFWICFMYSTSFGHCPPLISHSLAMIRTD